MLTSARRLTAAVAARAGAAAVPACAIGGGALFVWPFLGLRLPASTVLIAGVAALLLAVIALEAGTRRLDTRMLALLATLAALDAALRLALVTGIAGFTLIFLLMLCAGAVFGAGFGFLTGAFSLLVSALVTGGVGPWLPYEMVAAGWVGAAGALVRRGDGEPPGRARLWALAAVGGVAGYAYGAVMDVWDWSYFRGAPGLGWSPGMPVAEALGRFTRFYVTTSVAYDSFRAAGNALLVLTLGGPLVIALTRLRRRLTVTALDAVPVPPGADALAPTPG